MSNISDWFAWDCEGFKNQFVPFQGIMGTKNGNLWCQKPKKKGLYSQFQTSAAPLKKVQKESEMFIKKNSLKWS